VRPSSIATVSLATGAAGAALAAAVWWYRGLPRVQGRRRLKDRERMIEGFRERLRKHPGEGPAGGPAGSPGG
jgi:hypothetical protein